MLTPDGHRFLASARRVIAAVADATHALRAQPKALEGQLSIGVTPLVAGYYLSELLSRFTRACPAVEVRVLEDDGFIRREENPRNRKSSLLVLTEKGEEIYRRVHMDRRAFFNMLTADFSETDLAQLDEMLLRMARRADRMARDGTPNSRLDA